MKFCYPISYQFDLSGDEYLDEDEGLLVYDTVTDTVSVDLHDWSDETGKVDKVPFDSMITMPYNKFHRRICFDESKIHNLDVLHLMPAQYFEELMNTRRLERGCSEVKSVQIEEGKVNE